jgi:hypothetical protein
MPKPGKTRPATEDLPAKLRDLIATLDTELGAIGTVHRQSLEAQPAPEMIYHYTDDAGLQGIIEHGTLWCTDVAYLNDPSEIKYGVSIAAETLAANASGASLLERLFSRDFRRYETSTEDVAQAFVCSLSTKGNDLQQWRGYGNNGRGYAIGFDGKMLETVFTQKAGQPIPEHMSFPVCYDEVKLRGIYRELIAKVMRLVSAPATMDLSEAIVEAYLRQHRISLALEVFRTSLFFKHPAYASEQEYRFMQVHSTDRPPAAVKFRSRPNMLVRYQEIHWKGTAPDALKDIVIGPGVEPRIGGRFVDDCLRAYFPTAQPHVRLSGIPYRPS